MNERFARATAIARIELAHEPDFWVGSMEVRPSLREIACSGRRETIDRRVMQVLVALARADGGVVSRDDLIESCWEGVIVGEDAINSSIGRLRKVAEAVGNTFSIETVPRVGYRLKVEEAPAVPRPDSTTAADGAPQTGPDAVPRTDSSKQRQSNRTITRSLRLGIVCLALIIPSFALWWFWPRHQPAPLVVHAPEASVAVLPFANMSGDASKDYFGDGVSEELRNDLSNDPRLRVVARTSAFAFKGKNQDVELIARALRVRAIVEGSVREAGNRVRITAELIDAGNGYRIWSATYDRDMADILTVQDNVARAIATALARRLVPEDASASKTNPAIYRMYLEGRRLFRLPDTSPPKKIDPAVYRQYLQAMQLIVNSFTSRDANVRAFALLEHVTATQPDFAQGFAALSVAAANSAASVDPAHVNSYVATSRRAIEKTLSLDPHNFQTRMIRTYLELGDWNWHAATADVRAMQSENPNNIYLLDALRTYYAAMGFPRESIAVAVRERESDPLSDAIKLVLAGGLDNSDRFRELVDTARTVLAHEPDQSSALFYLCEAYAYTGRTKEAQAIEARLRRLHLDPTSNSDSETCEFDVALNTGNLTVARNIVQNRVNRFPDKFGSASAIADLYVLLGDFDQASDWYERAYERREPSVFWVPSWPNAVKYRSTPRWKALTQQPLFKEWQAEHDRIAAAQPSL